MENKDKLINLERLNQFKLNLVESKDNSLDITNEDQSKIDIKAKISEEEGNILTLKEDGLYVAPDGSLLSTDNSISIEVTDEGTDLTLKKSKEEDNAIEKKEDGVFVQKYDMATEDEVMTLLGEGVVASILVFLGGREEEIKIKGEFVLESRLRYTIQGAKISKSVTSLGKDAFYSCQYLSSVELNDSVVSLGSYCFYNDQNLTNVKMSNNLKEIGIYAFAGCYYLQDLTIPKTVETIGSSAFSSLSQSGTLRCNQEWFNNLSEENRTNLGNLANWTKEWID